MNIIITITITAVILTLISLCLHYRIKYRHMQIVCRRMKDYIKFLEDLKSKPETRNQQ